jgi:hypothetical protein
VKLAPEHQSDFDAMPSALRGLVEAELVAGNEVLEVGHTHPAPPIGAYFKLARPFVTRERSSGGGLSFYERNSSLHSGEFTDGARIFWILEAPRLPEAVPDIESIRRGKESAEQQTSRALHALAAREAATGMGKRSHRTKTPRLVKHSPTPASVISPNRALEPLTDSATSASRLFHFRDRRPPHEIQAALECAFVTPMQPAFKNGSLCYPAKVKVTVIPYEIVMRFEAALARSYAYSLRFDVSWADMPATHHDYFRKSCVSWFGFWTREFTEAPSPGPGDNEGARYTAACEMARQAEADLSTVPALQHAILAAMRAGASYTTVHKEGGTTIRWDSEHFVRADYGDSSEHQTHSDDAQFLGFLRQFYDWETSRNVAPDKVSDLDAWRLMLRLLSPSSRRC